MIHQELFSITDKRSQLDMPVSRHVGLCSCAEHDQVRCYSVPVARRATWSAGPLALHFWIGQLRVEQGRVGSLCGVTLSEWRLRGAARLERRRAVPSRAQPSRAAASLMDHAGGFEGDPLEC